MTKTRGATPAGRRASLIVRMSNAAREAGVVPRRIHLVVAIDRLLVRLLQAAPGQWVVKGGDASQLRRPDDVTEDLDLKIDAAIETAPRKGLQRPVPILLGLLVAVLLLPTLLYRVPVQPGAAILKYAFIAASEAIQLARETRRRPLALGSSSTLVRPQWLLVMRLERIIASQTLDRASMAGGDWQVKILIQSSPWRCRR